MQDFSGQNLRGRNFKGQDLTGANFVGADIRGANFSRTVLHNADFTGVTAGLAPGWRIPAILWGLGLCGLELGLTFGIGYILFFSRLWLSVWMFADLFIHLLLTLTILELSFNLWAIAGWSRGAIIICRIILIVMSIVIAFWGAATGGMAGWDAYWAAGNERYPNCFPVDSLAAVFFSGLCMGRTWLSSDMAWKYVKKSRQQQSNPQSPPTDTKNSLLQATTIAILRNGITRFRGADLTGTNFTDANLQDTEF
jgi:Pentapeptide repeats (8 copies)